MSPASRARTAHRWRLRRFRPSPTREPVRVAFGRSTPRSRRLETAVPKRSPRPHVARRRRRPLARGAHFGLVQDRRLPTLPLPRRWKARKRRARAEASVLVRLWRAVREQHPRAARSRKRPPRVLRVPWALNPALPHEPFRSRVATASARPRRRLPAKEFRVPASHQKVRPRRVAPCRAPGSDRLPRFGPRAKWCEDAFTPRALARKFRSPKNGNSRSKRERRSPVPSGLARCWSGCQTE